MTFEDYFDSVKDGPGVWKWRHYFPIYERHFAKFRGREVHVLECGVLGGGSLAMWHACLGDQAYVYGVDILEQCRIHEGPRTRIFIGDQGDSSFWQRTLEQIPRLDIVIDDGAHSWQEQVATLHATLPALAPGGVYLCEDIYRCDNPFQNDLSKVCAVMNEFGSTGNTAVEMAPGQVVPMDHIVTSNQWQECIESVSFYPFAAVIEIRDESLKQLSAPQHGTQWG